MIDKLIKWIEKFWEPEYDKEYFINLFENLKEEEVGWGSLANHCALHHVGVKGSGYPTPDKAIALAKLLYRYASVHAIIISTLEPVWRINDYDCYPGGSPRQRILTALKSL